jgi:hypothetical protein
MDSATAAIDAVGVPYPDETHEYAWKQTLFYLEQSDTKR